MNINDNDNNDNELYLFDHKTYIKYFTFFHISIAILVEETSIKGNTLPLSWNPPQFQYTFVDKYYIHKNTKYHFTITKLVVHYQIIQIVMPDVFISIIMQLWKIYFYFRNSPN